MSEHSISIVPRQSNYPNNNTKAREILDWLVSKDIVKPILSNCILGSDNGYAISDGAKQITHFPEDVPFDFATNGLEIVTKRQIFYTGENGIENLICPSCGQDIAKEDWDFLSEWGDNESNNLTCPLCNVATDIHQFNFAPEWGFSDLGFIFWNFPTFTDNFIDEFKKKLDCETSVVNQHI